MALISQICFTVSRWYRLHCSPDGEAVGWSSRLFITTGYPACRRVVRLRRGPCSKRRKEGAVSSTSWSASLSASNRRAKRVRIAATGRIAGDSAAIAGAMAVSSSGIANRPDGRCRIFGPANYSPVSRYGTTAGVCGIGLR